MMSRTQLHLSANNFCRQALDPKEPLPFRAVTCSLWQPRSTSEVIKFVPVSAFTNTLRRTSHRILRWFRPTVRMEVQFHFRPCQDWRVEILQCCRPNSTTKCSLWKIPFMTSHACLSLTFLPFHTLWRVNSASWTPTDCLPQSKPPYRSSMTT